MDFAAIMASENNIALTITFIDSELTAEELNDEAVLLLEELSHRSDIESADRVRDPNPPDGNKSIGGFLTGLLKTEVNPANGLKVLSFLGDHLSNKPITLEVEGNGKKLKLTVNNREEMASVLQQAKDFIGN